MTASEEEMETQSTEERVREEQEAHGGALMHQDARSDKNCDCKIEMKRP